MGESEREPTCLDNVIRMNSFYIVEALAIKVDLALICKAFWGIQINLKYMKLPLITVSAMASCNHPESNSK